MVSREAHVPDTYALHSAISSSDSAMLELFKLSASADLDDEFQGGGGGIFPSVRAAFPICSASSSAWASR